MEDKEYAGKKMKDVSLLPFPPAPAPVTINSFSKSVSQAFYY